LDHSSGRRERKMDATALQSTWMSTLVCLSIQVLEALHSCGARNTFRLWE